MSSSSSTAAPDKSHLITTYPTSAFPSGYVVSSTHSGIKSKSPTSPDLGILISTSPNPCIAAATFTRNVFKAAPVQVSNEVIKKRGGRVRGFVVSSGCANAVTGQKGLEDAWKMSRAVDEHAPEVQGEGGKRGEVGTLVMSTGVIGQHLPIDKITTSIPHLTSSLSSTPEAWLGLAKAFMTTDTFPKLRTREFKINDQLVKLVGIDKGAGMIHPNMGPPHGTLLGVIATDAKVHPEALQKALGWAVDRSFNSITVDGDMSTNDTVLCLANGAAGVSIDGGSGSGSSQGMKEISEEGTPEEYEVFKRELTGFAEELAQLVVRDGEGATKFVTVRVEVSSGLFRYRERSS
jgi:glutamate N-acetyltransferase/amino-acid N-acetyltransferase